MSKRIYFKSTCQRIFVQPLRLECLLAISNHSSKLDEIECNATNLNAATGLENVDKCSRLSLTRLAEIERKMLYLFVMVR